MPSFILKYTDEAKKQLADLEKDKSQKASYRAVKKTLGLMETDLHHPSLNTHKHESLTRITGEQVFQSYAQNKRPAAFRVFWKYGPGKQEITVASITTHP